MHIVTKVLVVFAAVLSVLLAALTMSYSVNADRIVSELRAERNAKLAAQTQAAADVAKAGDEIAAKAAMIAALNTELTDHQVQIRQLESERAQLIKDVRAAQAGRDAIERKIDELTSTTRTQASLIESYRDEVTKLRDNELRYRQNEIQLVDRINDLESQSEVLEANVRALQEQLTEARLALENAGQPGTGTGVATRGGEPTRIPIRGRIVETMRDQATGATLVRIDVGANDQVRENMKLYVSRGDKFLGNLLVRQADLQWAIGQVDTLGQPVDIRQGDLVTSSLR